MKVGICTGFDQMQAMQVRGFDYIEFALNGVAAMEIQDYEAIRKRIKSSGIPCEVCNCFFPGSIKLTGPEADLKIIGEYAAKALKRAAELGVQVAVVGSGGSRRMPDGWDMERGTGQFAEALTVVGEKAAVHGIEIVIEPLNRGETNLVNSVREGLVLAKRVGSPNVSLLADFYHMRLESEGMESVIQAGSYLKHTHIANSQGRVFPLDRKEDTYDDFFSALRQIGYQGRISIETGGGNPETDAQPALKLMRELAGTV